MATGQVLVMHDLLGIYDKPPKFSRMFGSIGRLTEQALESYVGAVQDQSFPSPGHTVCVIDRCGFGFGCS